MTNIEKFFTEKNADEVTRILNHFSCSDCPCFEECCGDYDYEDCGDFFKAWALCEFRGDELNVMIDELAFMPTRGHDDDAGLDLYSPIDINIRAHDKWTIDTGVHVALPEGTVGMIKSRSGMYTKNGLHTEGVVDVGFTGSIRVCVVNLADEDYLIRRGDRIAQLVVMPYVKLNPAKVESFEDTDRGADGFGSSGR